MLDRNTKGPTSADVGDILVAWNLGAVRDVTSDTLGTINRTWLVTADTGRYAVRLSGHRDVSALKRECELLAFAVAHGVPAIEPVRSRTGLPFVEIASGLWTVTPFAPGTQADRKQMTPEQDRGMGRCLAGLINALSTCPEHLGKRRSMQVDVQKTLSEIARYEALIQAHPNPGDSESYALGRLKGRREWIERHTSEKTDGLTRLDHQVLHGDFQEKNVFFDEGGAVVALIDWDNAWTAPPEWEIIRTLNFVMEFDPGRGQTFAEGYTELRDLDMETLDRAAWAYGVSRTHELWLFDEIYVRGSERARRFLRPGPFQPVYDRWVPLRDALKSTLG